MAKVFMTSSYGDIQVDTYVDYADDAESDRLIDLKAARTLSDEESKQNLIFIKVGKAKASPST